MPILTTPTKPVEETPVEPVVEIVTDERPELPFTPSYRDNVVRSKDTGLQALLPHISGSSWTVDFYLDVSGADQTNTGFTMDAEEGQIFQQYHRIRDMELKVTSPLDAVLDETSGVHALEGTANFYARMKPNEGNVLVADIGNGRTVLFEVTRAVPRSVLKNSIYEITYRSKFEVTDEVRRVLSQSTVKTSVFVKESLFGISRGLFSPDEHSVYLDSKKRLRALAELYGRTFYDSDYDTILLNEESVYDPYMVNFINQLPLDTQLDGQRYRELIIDANGLQDATILQKLLGENWPPHKYIINYTEEPVAHIYAPLVFGGIGVTNIKSLIMRGVDTSVPPDASDVLDTLPLFHDLPADTYIFTSDLYHHDQPMSVLELEIKNILTGKAISMESIAEMAKDENINALSMRQRFYYMPLLMFLLGVVIREY